MKSLDEYGRNSKNNTPNGINDDSTTYIYNNVQSCLAVAILHSKNSKMIGVHFTLGARNGAEMTGAIDKIKDILDSLKATPTRIYLAGAYSKYYNTAGLITELKKLTRNVSVIDVPVIHTGSADVDIKFVSRGLSVDGYLKPRGSNLDFMPASFKNI